MSLHNFYDSQFNLRIQSTLTSMKSTEDVLYLITNDGQSLSANQNLFRILSRQMSSLIGQLPCGQIPTVSLDASAEHVSALIKFVVDGEFTFENRNFFKDVKSLANSIGIGIFNNEKTNCVINDDSLRLFEWENDGELIELEEVNLEMEESQMKMSQFEFQLEFYLDEFTNMDKENKIEIINEISKVDEVHIDTTDDKLEGDICFKFDPTQSMFRYHEFCHTNCLCEQCQKCCFLFFILRRRSSTCPDRSFTECCSQMPNICVNN